MELLDVLLLLISGLQLTWAGQLYLLPHRRLPKQPLQQDVIGLFDGPLLVSICSCIYGLSFELGKP